MEKINKKKKILKIFILFVCICMGIQNALSFGSAAGYGINSNSELNIIEITDANYLDLDDDGTPDDVNTEFTIFSPTGEISQIAMDFEFYLTLPSGKTFKLEYSTTETFNILPIRLEWYNVVEEAGWYTFTIKADLRGVDENGVRFNLKILESIEFDPRDYKVGGLPFGIIYF